MMTMTVTISDNTTLERQWSFGGDLSVDNPVQGGFWVTVIRDNGTANTSDLDFTGGTDNVGVLLAMPVRTRQ